MEKLEDENLKYEKKMICPRCKNSDIKDCFGCLGQGVIDSDFQICPVCNGNPLNQNNGTCHCCKSFGYVGQFFLKCEKCGGEGVEKGKQGIKCHDCFGFGMKIKFEDLIEIEINKVIDVIDKE
eukprot:gene1920-1060_t